MWGKVLGAMTGAGAGFLLSLPPLAIVALGLGGLVAGHLLFDDEPTPSAPRRVRPPPPAARPPLPPRPPLRPEEPTPEERALVDTLAPLFIELARVDAAVSQVEVKVTREFFERVLGLGARAQEPLRLGLKAALAAPKQDLELLARAARGGLKPSLRVDVLRGLYDVALADGDLLRTEAEALKQVVQHFNLSDEQLQTVTTEFFGTGDAHYRVLGLLPSATDDELRQAFRRLATENHPDRVAALGPQEAQAAAVRFREVKDAWDALRKLRGR